MNSEYKKLEEQFRDINLLGQASAILGWDANTYMPEGASENRGEQLALLSKISHQKLVQSDIGSLLERATPENDWQKANLRCMKHQYSHTTCLPEKLATELTLASNTCEVKWRKCRAENDFKGILPELKKVVDLTMEMAEIKSSKLGLSKYDSLLDMYDPGRRSADVEKVFSVLENFLPTFINEVIASQPTHHPIEQNFPIDTQKALGKHFMGLLGFDFNKGRLDESTHPFCGGTPDDVRITTRYREDDFFSSLLGTLHETGHSLYESNLPKSWRYQCVGEAMGMSTHESQSLFVEKQIGLSNEFIGFLHPKIKEFFGVEINPQTLRANLQQVKKSFIRVDADEVTYPLHVILRYRIEKALIEGEIQVEDLPEVWNSYMQKYLQITPNSDTEGCLQDIHWYGGMIGYFPTYTLGALTAAQLMAKLKQEMPDVSQKIARGELKPIIAWMTNKIHKHGSFFLADDLLKNATGEFLNPQYFIDHVKNRYLAKNK